MNIGYVICETATTSKDTPVKIISRNETKLIGEGILQDMNVRNRNGRFYDSRDLSPEIKSPRTLELLNSGNLRAENGHPMSKDIARQQTIDPSNTTAIFVKLWTDGDDIKSWFRGTNNAQGEEFNQDLIDGFWPSWSLRALGSIENTRRGAEVKGVRVITWDRVIYPSHARAYTTGIVGGAMQESAYFIEENDKGLIIPITNEQVINYIKSQSNNIKSMMESFDIFYDNMELIQGQSQLKLTDKAGGIFVVNLENYIHNEIMNYCYNK
jgi:hypothetical protein